MQKDKKEKKNTKKIIKSISFFGRLKKKENRNQENGTSKKNILYNIILEIIWTVVPILILLSIAIHEMNVLYLSDTLVRYSILVIDGALYSCLEIIVELPDKIENNVLYIDQFFLSGGEHQYYTNLDLLLNLLNVQVQPVEEINTQSDIINMINIAICVVYAMFEFYNFYFYALTEAVAPIVANVPPVVAAAPNG